MNDVKARAAQWLNDLRSPQMLSLTAMLALVGGCTTGSVSVSHRREVTASPSITMADGYIRVTVHGESIRGLEFDPTGHGRYGSNAIDGAAPPTLFWPGRQLGCVAVGIL